VALATAHGLPARLVDGDPGDAVREALSTGGVQALVVRTERVPNVAVHDRCHAAVAAALAASG
jgi:hypothetical protein